MNETSFIKKFEDDRRARQDAEKWYALLLDESHGGERFKFSPLHSNVVLMICGQHAPGQQNYHESPKPLNDALRHVLVERHAEIVAAAIQRLRDTENESRANAHEQLEAALADTAGVAAD